MNHITVFRVIVPMFLVLFSMIAHAEDSTDDLVMLPDVQLVDDVKPINLANLELPDLPPIHVPTLLEEVQQATNDFLDSVQEKIQQTASSGYVWYASGVDLRKEVTCLAQNIYYEARGEPIEGKLAIANTTINRVRSFLYPQTICQVVWQPLQFSWTNHKLKYKTPHDEVRWEQAEMIAQRALEGGRLDNLEDVTDGAINFHAVTVHPKWRKLPDLEKTVKIGHHIFYRMKPLIEARVNEPVVNGEQ